MSAQGPGRYEEVPCNLCFGREATTVFAEGRAQKHRIVRCKHCGLLYASPREIEHEYSISYDADIDFSVDEVAAKRLEKEELQVADYRQTQGLLRALHPERGRLLEIGSSFGFLLASFAQDEWKTVGVDPYSGACRYARKRFGLDIREGILEEAGIDDGSCDVVIMNHVIEHLPDPLGTLRLIRRVLKPGGHLVIETPRYDTLTFKLLGRRERSIRCDGHVYFFTAETLTRMCEAAGFRLTKRWTTGRRLTLERLAWNLGVVCREEWLRKGLERFSRACRLDRFWVYLNLGDIQRVCVEKTGDPA
ncbi:MAG: class I SAM-dependent methyltransferase [Terracidiphilus sp.]